MEFVATLLIYAALFVLSELLRPKPDIENARPAGLGDFSFPTATEERVVPIVWGTVELAGPNVTWYGDLREFPLVNKVSTGLFSKINVTVGFRYFVGIQFSLCRGSADLRVIRVTIDSNEVFAGVQGEGTIAIDEPTLFSLNSSRAGDAPSNEGVAGTLAVHVGTTTQATDDYLELHQLVGGATPRYTGTAYCVWYNLGGIGFGGGWISNSTQIRPWAFEVRRIPNGLGLASPSVNDAQFVAGVTTNGVGQDYVVGDVLKINGGTSTSPARIRVLTIDATGGVLTSTIVDRGTYSVLPTNPVTATPETGVGINASFTLTFASSADAAIPNVIYEILTDPEWGRKQSPSSIDVANFTAAAATLRAEGNGWSAVWDRATKTGDLIKELERQMDGVLFRNHVTGKWQITLARADYNILTVPLIDDTVAAKVLDYTRSAWADTANQIKVQFKSRAREYTGSYGLAQDTANVRVQGGRVVPATAQYPGVKNEALANSIAWRGIRAQSYPLAKARIEVDRSFYAATPGSVVAWTSSRYGFVRLPMRVARVNLGTLQSNRIVLDLVQDVFFAAAGAFGNPPPPGWTPPGDSLLAFINTAIFEAPRAFTTRGGGVGADVDRIWAGAERRGVEGGFVMYYDTAATPDYVETGAVYALLHVCTLAATLNRGSSPVSTVSITASSAGEKAEILEAMTTGTLLEIGTELRNLIRVGDEYMLVTSAVSGSGNAITLNGVYRGVMDSVQGDHASSAAVWILHSGGGMTNDSFAPSTSVDMKLAPMSRLAELPLASISPTTVVMANRLRRAYPAAQPALNGTAYPTTAALEGAGTGDDVGIQLIVTRRDYRTPDEVAALSTDAAIIFADFPAANTVEHQLKVYNDPAGANTLLFTMAYQASGTFVVKRRTVLHFTDGVLPTTLGYVVRSRHTVSGTVYESRVDLDWDAAVTTGLTGDFNFGALDQSEESNQYDVVVDGDYTFTLGTALASGGMEFQVNNGGWSAMSGGGTSWTILAAAISPGDNFDIRHTCSTAGTETLVEMAAPGAGIDGYAVLFKT